MQKFLIAHGDFLLKRSIKKYVDFNHEQEKKLNHSIDQFWASLGQPPYLKVYDELNTIITSAPTGLSLEKYNQFTEKIVGFTTIIWNTHGAALSEILASLTNEQLSELEQNLKDSNKDIEEQILLPTEKFATKDKKKNIERFENWYGSITAEQEQLLSSQMNSQDILKRRLHSRISSQKNFIAFLKTKPSSETIQKQILTWISSPELLRDPEARADFYYVSDFFKHSLLEREKLATAEQKLYSQNKLQKIMSDIKANFEKNK